MHAPAARVAAVEDGGSASYTAFEGHRMLASGSLHDVTVSVQRAAERASQRNPKGTEDTLTVFDDTTGRVIDVDMRGARAEPADAAEAGGVATDAALEPRKPGRPKLGVVAREITLLPRHWDWLASQPGGASVTLRKLVEDARRRNTDADRRRAARDAAYHFISAIAGDLPGFEEIARALFAGDSERFESLMHAWPADVRDHAVALLGARAADGPSG